TRFLAAGDWRRYNEAYERHYLAGDLEALAAAAQGFPTYCEPIIGARDALLAERMAPELDAGGACVIVGVAHCRGVLAWLAAGGQRGERQQHQPQRAREVEPLRAHRLAHERRAETDERHAERHPQEPPARPDNGFLPEVRFGAQDEPGRAQQHVAAAQACADH